MLINAPYWVYAYKRNEPSSFLGGIMEDAGNQNNNQTGHEQTTHGNNAASSDHIGSARSSTSTGSKANQIAEYVFWVLAAIVLLRFAFKLIGANSHNAIVVLIYNATNPVINMFKGIVGDVVSGPMVIEFSDLIAVLILWLIYKAVVKLITIAR
jgi:uncharacterized protein YggT (Ycf19 family)